MVCSSLQSCGAHRPNHSRDDVELPRHRVQLLVNVLAQGQHVVAYLDGAEEVAANRNSVKHIWKRAKPSEVGKTQETSINERKHGNQPPEHRSTVQKQARWPRHGTAERVCPMGGRDLAHRLAHRDITRRVPSARWWRRHPRHPQSIRWWVLHRPESRCEVCQAGVASKRYRLRKVPDRPAERMKSVNRIQVSCTAPRPLLKYFSNQPFDSKTVPL